MNTQSANSKTQFSSLLSEVGLVADYAARRGMVTAGLLRAYQYAEDEFGRTGKIEQHLDSLVREMKETENKFPSFEFHLVKSLISARQYVPRILFYVACVIVIFSTSIYTTRYIALRDNVTNLAQLEQQNITDVAFRFWMVASGKKLPGALVSDPPSTIEKDLLLERLEKIAQINNDLTLYLTEVDSNVADGNQDFFLHLVPNKIEQILTGFDVNKWRKGEGYGPLDASSLPGQPSPYGVAGNEKPGPVNSRVTAAAPTALAKEKVGRAGGLDRFPARATAASKAALTTTPDPFAGFSELKQPIDTSPEAKYFDAMNLRGIVRQLGTNLDASSGAPIEGTLNSERQMMGSYGQIVLPVLLGMLGAIVYNLRIMLNSPELMPSFWRVNLRVMIGGLAGVSGSVFVSTIGQGPNGQFAGGIWLFLLAFLLGFSLEVFFKILDALIHSVENKLVPPPSVQSN